MPEKIGPYTVVSQLGRGGMGVVYKAHDQALNRFVAIKVLTENLTEDQTFLQRFVREAQAAAGLSHPNIVQIYSIGEDEGRPYFVMEYVTGRSVDQLLRTEGLIDNPRASQLILQAAHGLAAAHDLGIIHRDIKPANLMLDDRGMLKIADFGLALPVDAETRLTATGMFVGTPGYFSPEQCSGEQADHRTDIYALGVTYYLLLTGTPPFRGESPLALLKQILDANPPDVTTLNANVDAESRRILGKMIAKDREQRYQSCHELIADLENFLASRGIRSMTMGLGTRVPSSSPELAAAMEAPTQVLEGSSAAKVMTQPVRTAAEAATTVPDTPLLEPPTQPATPVAVVPQPRRSSSKAILIVALIAFVIVAGGAIAAVKLGTNLFRGFQAQLQEGEETVPITEDSTGASQEPADASPVETPSRDMLLSQTITPPLSGGLDTTVSPAGSGTLVESHAQSAQTQAPLRDAVAPASRSAAVEQTQQARPPATQVARQSAVEPPQRTQRRAGVVVAATGDPNLVGAVAAAARSELQDSGLDVIDAQTLPATEDLLRGGDVSAKRLIDALRSEGYAVLLLARIDAAGERELSYYGRRDIAYSSRITLTSYDLATGRPIGSSQSASIEYTAINASRESADVVAPLVRASARAIRNR
jgi:eukaryotic-like serine/threonine-protein kinase